MKDQLEQQQKKDERQREDDTCTGISVCMSIGAQLSDIAHENDTAKNTTE